MVVYTCGKLAYLPLRELLVLFTDAIMFCTSEVWKKRKKMEK